MKRTSRAVCGIPPRRRSNRVIRAVIARVLLWCLCASAAPVLAHMPAGYDLRAVHFVQERDGLHGYMRLTLPLAVAKDLGAPGAGGFHAAAPYTVLRIESNHAFYYPDMARLRTQVQGLGELIARGHRLEGKYGVLVPQVRSVRVYPKGSVPPFNDLDQARAATAPGPAYPDGAPDVEVAYVVVDTHLVYAGGGDDLKLSSTLDNRVIGQPEIQNLIVYHGSAGDRVLQRVGRLSEPLSINPSRWGVLRTFVGEGTAHVLSGADHVLFVACLALGAAGWVTLAWRVTGFTLGHSLSLALGFFGYAPKGAWFVPAVETAIAVSVLIAGVSLLLPRLRRLNLLPVVTVVGFVHGLGFAVALRALLDSDGPHVWSALAGFNVGVELGQLMVALVVAFAAVALARLQPRLRQWMPALLATGCVAAAALWILERSRPLLA